MPQKKSSREQFCGEVRLPPPLSSYAVTSDGRVIGYWRGRVVLSGSLDKDGYRRFTLIADDLSRAYPRAAQLICAAFNGPCPDGMEVRHLNGNNSDDSAGNLIWGTHQQNIDDKTRHGTVARGERSGTAKMTEAQVREIKSARKTWGMGVRFAARFNVTPSAISDIFRGRTWGHIK